MQVKVKKLDVINKIVFDSMYRILKKLNKRIHIRLYAIVYDEQSNLVDTVRIKKTVAIKENASSTSQITIPSITDVFGDLKIDCTNVAAFEEIKHFVNQKWFNQVYNEDTSDSQNPETAPSVHLNEQITKVESQRVLYINQLPFHDGNTSLSIAYLLEMQNIERETIQLFYNKPEISFLRMLLDFFFADFFACDNGHITIDDADTIRRKYNEDGIQFSRRLTRLFFGKMQKELRTDTRYDQLGHVYEHKTQNEYYVNNLLEKIDDISNLTYENSNPFGSILFMNKDVISKQAIIRFTVTFTEKNRIGLEDAKRIRKLLELTNAEKDLYLIADENVIYGLGEVNWGLLKNVLAIRLDFTGQSKYNLSLVRTESEPSSEGELFVHNGKKIYRSQLRLIETKLVSVAFKNPKLGEDGYSLDRLASLLKSTFWDEQPEDDQINYKIENLDRIVSKAREQKHGTMVVVTDSLTAKSELQSLKKQSTLIEPSMIDPEYIKFLTAIDGAIYFDIDGNCHAIGVILDGVAKKDIGDASRGARFNSAHRYLHKLKDQQKKCVIVIISEDGMVDLIPESENEDMLLELAHEIIDMITEENNDTEKLKEKENYILSSKLVDCDWLFKIGEVYYKNKNYEQALVFFENGIERAGKNRFAKYYNYAGICYSLSRSDYSSAARMYELAYEAADNFNDKYIYSGNYGVNFYFEALEIKNNKKSLQSKLKEAIDWLSRAVDIETTNKLKPKLYIYDCRGTCYFDLSKIVNEDQKDTLLHKAVEDFSQTISIKAESSYFWSRFNCYEKLGRVREGIEDLVQAESLNHDKKHIDKLSEILKKTPHLISYALEYYRGLDIQPEKAQQLDALLSELFAKGEANNQAEPAAGKESSQEKDSK